MALKNMKKRKVKCKNGNTVERWYDRPSRSCVVAVFDPQHNQIGDADYSGDTVSRDFAAKQMILENGGEI